MLNDITNKFIEKSLVEYLQHGIRCPIQTKNIENNIFEQNNNVNLASYHNIRCLIGLNTLNLVSHTSELNLPIISFFL